MSILVAKLQESFGFQRTPMDPGDGGIAFVHFLQFASGDSEMAHQLQATYFQATGKRPCNDMRATAPKTGEFIDWLIETQWGEASAAAVH